MGLLLTPRMKQLLSSAAESLQTVSMAATHSNSAIQKAVCRHPLFSKVVFVTFVMHVCQIVWSGPPRFFSMLLMLFMLSPSLF